MRNNPWPAVPIQTFPSRSRIITPRKKVASGTGGPMAWVRPSKKRSACFFLASAISRPPLAASEIDSGRSPGEVDHTAGLPGDHLQMAPHVAFQTLPSGYCDNGQL